jgi:Na+/H+ antiporter NhaC
MGNFLYIVAVILIIVWAIGFFAYTSGNVIHVLLVIAIIAIIVKLVQGKRVL